MTTPHRLSAKALTALVLGLPLLAACTNNTAAPANDAGDGRSLTVRSTDTECALSAPTAPSGDLRFSVTNAGSQVTEFYLLGEDGLRVIAEVENIGPGLSRDLVVTAPPGSYFIACKPGMVGDGIRSDFTVVDS
jgi:iron uptake system component EfeO